MSGGRISASSCCSHQRQAADLAGVGLFVDAALAAPLELEMLDRVGDVGALAVDSRLRERAIEQLPGRPDERTPGQILLIARLLADEHDLRVERPFAEHRLGARICRGRSACSASPRRGSLPMISPALSPSRAADAATISASRACAPLISSGTNAVSGMFFQYFFGISFSIAPIFTRAGLKMRGVIGLPDLLDRIALRRIRLGRAGAFAEASSPSQWIESSGVRIDQRMLAKRRTKKPALARTIWCVGLEPGDVARRPRPRGSGRRRASCACRAAPPWPSPRAGGAAGRRHPPSPCGSAAQPEQQGVEQGEALGIRVADRRSRASSTKGRGTGNAEPSLGVEHGLVAEQICGASPTCQTTSLGGTRASASARAASRQPSKSSSAIKATTRMLASSGEQLQLFPLWRSTQAVGEPGRAPVGGDQEGAELGDRNGQPGDIVEPQPAEAARGDDPVHRAAGRGRARAAAPRAAHG